jgi:hypothetical protein
MHATIPAPIHRPTVTARGTVAVQVICLGDVLQELDASDRDYILGMLRELLEDATA